MSFHVTRLQPAAPAMPRLDGLLDFVAWTDRSGTLPRAIRSLAAHFGAEAGHFGRIDRASGHLATAGGMGGRDPALRAAVGPALRAMAGGGAGDGAGEGTGDGTADRMGAPLLPGEVRLLTGTEASRLAIICLAADGRRLDYLAFRRAAPACEAWLASARWSAALLCEAHARRAPGIVASVLAGAPDGAPDGTCGGGAASGAHGPEANILDCDNPCDLTAAEVRICAAVARGLSVKGVAFELGKSANTVRTHLRNIYLKTGCNGYFALARALISQTPAAPLRDAA